MCVAAIAWDAHPRWQLVAIGNRDEFHERPTAPLARWAHDTAPGGSIIAGRDLRAGGTWLGVSEEGSFALVTNFRVPGYPKPDRPSRGALVTDLISGKEPERVGEMNPFNLFHISRSGAQFISNHPEKCSEALPAGIHGLSNGAFERPWPKTRQLNAALGDWLTHDAEDHSPLFTALRNETSPDAPTPDDAPESRFASVFIRDPAYGTRCSTVVTIDRNGTGKVIERRFSNHGEQTGETALDFCWPG